MQINLQDGHLLVNYNEIHEKLQTFVSSVQNNKDSSFR